MKKIVVLAGACLLLTANCFTLEKATAASHASTLSAAVTKMQTAPREGEPRTYKVKLGNGKGQQVEFTMFNSDVEIIGHSGEEVIIETSDYSAPPQRAEGLKPLYNQMEDNTNLGLSVEKRGNTLTIGKASRNPGKYIIKVPRNASVVYKETNWEGSNLSISNMEGEIEAKLNNSDAVFSNVSGPVVANTTAGSIKVIFSALNQSKPSALSAVAGDIDITLPTNTKANFKLKSMQGEIYTDFDMQVQRDKDENTGLALVGGGGDIAGKVNGGGVEISVQSIASNIFIRKKK